MGNAVVRSDVGTMTLGELSEHLAASGLPNHVEGDRSLTITAVNTLEDAQPGELSFLANPKYLDRLAETKASAVLVDHKVAVPEAVAAVRSGDPYAGLCLAIVRIHGHRRHPQWGSGEGANIAEGVTIGPGANIAPDVTVAEGVRIGERVTIYPGCYIGPRSVLGSDVTL